MSREEIGEGKEEDSCCARQRKLYVCCLATGELFHRRSGGYGLPPHAAGYPRLSECGNPNPQAQLPTTTPDCPSGLTSSSESASGGGQTLRGSFAIGFPSLAGNSPVAELVGFARSPIGADLFFPLRHWIDEAVRCMRCIDIN